jgi:hypothetical protein
VLLCTFTELPIRLTLRGEKSIFASFSYRLNTIGDYVILLKDIHHEWISLTLNKVLNDKVRNKLIFIIRDIKHKIKNLFLRENNTGLTNPVQNNYSG